LLQTLSNKAASTANSRRKSVGPISEEVVAREKAASEIDRKLKWSRHQHLLKWKWSSLNPFPKKNTMFEILVQKRKHYPVINSEKYFQVKERDERVQETAPRKPKDEEGSTEIPVYVRETSLSSDGRARGYIECVREMEEFHFFAYRIYR